MLSSSKLTTQPFSHFQESLLHFASHLFGTTPHPAQLDRALQKLVPDALKFAVAPQQTHETYGRRVIYSDGLTEIMIAQWRPNRECAPHDHGNSIGHVVALSGEFVESSYEWRDRLLVKSAQRLVHSPEWLGVDNGQIHSMKCMSPQGGVTLHFYQPAIRAMKVFDLEKHLTYTVSDDCGAWAPQQHQTRATEPW